MKKTRKLTALILTVILAGCAELEETVETAPQPETTSAITGETTTPAGAVTTVETAAESSEYDDYCARLLN